ncbi:hypothetical protein A3C67_01430 [Candidatus Nomurabacteria bacterium RIFCSPHIGHO2_02_FULL_42_19]|uniref:Uncharacterized protein n=1 Tax=Candidatus Nomurabacteria bacterium RIFCSPHIGHO2_02_FULL_42_19 TaxID=1801756 RepID=A0A1F6W2H8_9BACT|nr:MAG: hypothetical protein A3C67_01430 [Candidatus Nomurabacteria bacterium RIFCSPHIGHO2_02_FULL_42_19]
MRILNTQEKLRDDLARLQKIVSYIAQDEVSPKYMKKLSKIERGLSLGRGIKFKTKSEIRKLFRSL